MLGLPLLLDGIITLFQNTLDDSPPFLECRNRTEEV